MCLAEGVGRGSGSWRAGAPRLFFGAPIGRPPPDGLLSRGVDDGDDDVCLCELDDSGCAVERNEGASPVRFFKAGYAMEKPRMSISALPNGDVACVRNSRFDC